MRESQDSSGDEAGVDDVRYGDILCDEFASRR